MQVKNTQTHEPVGIAYPANTMEVLEASRGSFIFKLREGDHVCC